jgi:hypothetical protein
MVSTSHEAMHRILGDPSDANASATGLDGPAASVRLNLALLTQLGLGSLPAAQTWRGLMDWNIESLRASPVLRAMLDEHFDKVRAETYAHVVATS